MRPAACAAQLTSCSKPAIAQNAAPRACNLSGRTALSGCPIWHKQRSLVSSQRRSVVITAQISNRLHPQGPVQKRTAWNETVQARTSFGSAWKPILKALLLPILFLPALLLPRAAFSKSASPIAPPTARTVEVWPCTHTPHQQTASSISDSTTSPSPISTTAVSHRVSSHHDAPVSSNHDEVVSSSRQHAVTQLDHIVAEHSVAQLAAAFALAILLLLALRSSRPKHAGSQFRESRRHTPVQPKSPEVRYMPAAPAQASDEDDEDDQYDSDTSQSETGFPVAQRRQKASRDIAAAKAREAAFAAQGRSQFTDSKTARPETPDFSDRNASPISTTMLDAPKRPRTQQNTSEGLDSEARRPGSSGATDTFALDDPSSRPGSSAGRKVQEALYEPDSSKSAQPQTNSERDAGNKPQADLGGKSGRPSSPKPTPWVDRQQSGGSLMSASANTKNTQADLESKSGRPSSPKPTPWVDRQRSEGSLVSASADREPRSRPVTPDPKRVNLGDRATPGEQSGREQALVESRRQSKPLTLSDKGPAVRSGQDAEDRAPAGGSLSDTKQSKSTQKRPVTPDPAPVQPEGKPSLAQQDAKQKGMGWFQRKGKQTDKPSQPAATVFLDSPEAQAPASERSRSDSKEPGVSQGPSSSKLPLSGRAPPGEHEAEMKAKAELKRKSQQTQPYKPVDREQLKGQGTGQAEDQQLGMSPEQAAAVYKPRPAISKQDQSQQQPELLSDSDQTSDLGSSLASSSMSAEPPISSAGSVAEPSSAAQRDQSPNRVRGFFSAVQDRVSGRKPAQSPRNTAAQTDLPSSPMQAQVQPQGATAAQRMAAANEAQAAERARQQQKQDVVVRKYQPVDLPGNVDDFVRARGVRAPLLLLYGLAASAAQTIEPLLPAQKQEAGGDGMLDVEAVNWSQLRKYDIFQQMLRAAASSPTSQEERFSPLRTLANAVPQEGIPKYDFLRNLLRNAAQPRDPKPSPKALASSSSAESESGWTLPPSLDPLAALLQDAKQPWQNVDSKYDPFKALSRALASTEEPTGSTATLDPLGNLLKSDQGQQTSGKAKKAARSKYDPFQAGWQSNAPSSPAPARRRKISEPRQPVTSKYDPFHQLFSAEGPSSETGSLDPLGAVLQSLRQPWDRPPSSKYDVFQAIFALEGPNAQRPSLDPLSALQQDGSMQPEESVKSKYDPFQALFNMEGPDAQRSGSRPTTPSVPTESVKSKYDPFQALFNMEGPDAQRPGLEQKAPSPPTESVKSKYDPFQALFQQEGPSSDKAALDPLGSLLQGIQRPRRPASSKYDVFQAILKLRGPSKQAPPLDPFGAALSDGKQPHQAPRSKYDPFQALFQSQMPAGDAPLDPLPHLIKAMTASSLLKKQQEQQQQSSGTQSDRFNPLQRLLSVEPPTGRTPGFDPLGALLKSSWVKDRRSRAEREPRREEDSREFGQAYSGPQGRQPSPSRGPRQIDDQQDMAQLMQQRATRQQPRQQVGEHEARERAMAALQAKAKGQTATAEDEQTGRPSEWAGFVYNPYSGDLLPQEGDDDMLGNEDPAPGSGSGASKASGPGQGKAQFVSANPSTRPVTKRQAIKAYAVPSREAGIAAGLSGLDSLPACQQHATAELVPEELS